jgi:PhzF family phenazine biosynthesis protein
MARAASTESAQGLNIEVARTVVFAAASGGGNPCLVVPGAGLTDAKMLAVAQHFGQESAFLLAATNAGADLRIRYFVPEHEMGISGHATVAAVTIALQTGRAHAGSLRIETSNGIFRATANKQGSDYLVTLEQNPPAFGEMTDAADTARVLGIDPSAIYPQRGPIQSVSVSRPKLIVPLRSVEALNGLKPNFEALWNLCDRRQVSGLYPFALPASGDTSRPSARQFPLRAGFAEDPATGVAAAALGAYLTGYALHFATGRHEFRVAQGYAMGAPSEIIATTECSNNAITRVAVRGSAKILSRESLDVNRL